MEEPDKPESRAPSTSRPASKLVEHAGRLSYLLTCHLEIEHAITTAFLTVAPEPKSFAIDEFEFDQKLRIAAGLGLIPRKLVPVIKFINKLRNLSVHDRDFEVTKEHLSTLVSQFEPSARQPIFAFREELEGKYGNDSIRIFDGCLLYTFGYISGQVSAIPKLQTDATVSLPEHTYRLTNGGNKTDA